MNKFFNIIYKNLYLILIISFTELISVYIFTKRLNLSHASVQFNKKIDNIEYQKFRNIAKK